MANWESSLTPLKVGKGGGLLETLRREGVVKDILSQPKEH